MKYQDPLIPGILKKRYKRFFADVILENGETAIAHCANSGSMLSVSTPGSKVWISPSRNPKRKLKYTWELAEINNTLIGVNTNQPNTLVNEAIISGKIKELQGFSSLRREVKYGKNSRIDILLENPDQTKCYVEVKSVTMKRLLGKEKPAEFPDAVTTRGLKHLKELSAMVADGHRAVMLYVIQRNDSKSFKLARDIDPEYGKAYDAAIKSGVEILGYSCKFSTMGINISEKVTALG